MIASRVSLFFLTILNTLKQHTLSSMIIHSATRNPQLASNVLHQFFDLYNDIFRVMPQFICLLKLFQGLFEQISF